MDTSKNQSTVSEEHAKDTHAGRPKNHDDAGHPKDHDDLIEPGRPFPEPEVKP